MPDDKPLRGVGAMYVERDQSLSIHPDTNVGCQVSQFR